MSVEHGRHRTTGHSGRPLARFGACQNLQVDRVTEGSLTKAALVEGVADVAYFGGSGTPISTEVEHRFRRKWNSDSGKWNTDFGMWNIHSGGSGTLVPES